MKQNRKTIMSIIMTLAVIMSITVNAMTALAAAAEPQGDYDLTYMSAFGNAYVTYYTGDASSTHSSGVVRTHIDKDLNADLSYDEKAHNNYDNYTYWVFDNGTLYVSANTSSYSSAAAQVTQIGRAHV